MTALINRPVSDRLATHSCITNWPSILCIDDDPDIHTSIELRMRSYEVEIEHAYYGMQGIAETLKNGADLIITDMAMPNGDGSYLVETIRRNARTASVPIIVLTGMRDAKLRSRVLRDGADVYLQKPVRFDMLLEHMTRFVELRERDDCI